VNKKKKVICMYENNDEVDKPIRKEFNVFYNYEVEALFIFCQLDRAMPYEKVCRAFNKLKENNLTNFTNLFNTPKDDVKKQLRIAGYRFPNQAVDYLYYNINNYTYNDLENMTRDEIVNNCKGFGYKLASMFYNRIHPDDQKYAIIDIHVDRYLKQHGCKEKSYKKKEEFLRKLAKAQGKSLEVLDWEIWNTNRIGNRNK